MKINHETFLNGEKKEMIDVGYPLGLCVVSQIKCLHGN